MIVHIRNSGTLELLEPDNFKELFVLAEPPRNALDSVNALLDPILDFDGIEHAWVSTGWLRSELQLAVRADRQISWNKMIEYAAKNSWLRDSPSAVRAHVVWAPRTTKS
jgi:hypothetical protein